MAYPTNKLYTNTTADQARIPRGVADYFWAEAYTRRKLEHSLLELFRAWGYQDVIPPLFEFSETFQNRANPKLQAEMYRFLDRDGSTLALRADMTISVARLVGVRLHDWPMPQRFCYSGSVFRYTELQAGRQREFIQAGVELIGAQSAAADAEIIAMTAEAIRMAGIDEFRLVLGQIQFFDGLLQALQLPPEQAAHLQRAIDRNSEAELAEFLGNTPLDERQRHTIEYLPQLAGSNASQIMERAEKLCLNATMHDAVANLRSIYQALEAHGVTGDVFLDLTEINNLGYYTGMSFEVLVPGTGFPIGSGGRYDNLVGTFGDPQPAVGVALGLDRMLLARETFQGEEAHQSVAPDILVGGAESARCLEIVNQWRSQGLRVVMNVDHMPGKDLWTLAQRQNIPLALTWTGQGFDVCNGAAHKNGAAEFVPAEDAADIADLVERVSARRAQSDQVASRTT